MSLKINSIIIKYIITLGFVLLLASCGGGNNSNLPSIPDPDYTISGKAFIGNVNNSTISLYSFSEGKRGSIITSVTTDESGLYKIITNTQNKILLACMSGGRYTEAYTGTTISIKNTDELCSVFINKPGSDSKIAITYYSHIAYGLSKYLISLKSETPIKSANETISTWVGFDIIKTLPNDITSLLDTSTTVTESYRAGFSNVAISVLADTNNPIRSIDIANQAYNDIIHDGLLDGKGINGLLKIGRFDITTKLYRHDIALDILIFANSQQNGSAITPVNLVDVATQYNTSKSSIFGTASIVSFSLDKPIIQNVNIQNDDILVGDKDITFDIVDLRGISNVSIKITNTNLALQQGIGTGSFSTIGNLEKPTPTLQTQLLKDGLNYTITITATNILNNIETLDVINLTINNISTSFGNISPPKPKLIAGQLVISYIHTNASQISATINDPLGIKSVTLTIDNGTSIVPDITSIAPDYIFKVDTTKITDGKHVFTFKAINITLKESTEKITYIVDNTPPVLQIIETNINDRYWSLGKHQIVGMVSDNIGIKSALLSFEGINETKVNQGKIILAAEITTNSPEGIKKLSFSTEDLAGNITTFKGRPYLYGDIIVDHTIPTITFSQYTDNRLVNEKCYITYKTYDIHSGPNFGRVETVLVVSPIQEIFPTNGPNIFAMQNAHLLPNQSGTEDYTYYVYDYAMNRSIQGSFQYFWNCGPTNCTCGIL